MKTEAQQLPEPVFDLEVLKAALRAGVDQRRSGRKATVREEDPPVSLTLAEVQAIEQLEEEPGFNSRLLQVRSFLQISEAHLVQAEQLVQTVLTPLTPRNPSRWQRVKAWIFERLGRFVGMRL